MPVPSTSSKILPPRPPQHGRPLGSAQTSPSNPSLAMAGGHSLTHSSVTGSYIYVTVQVTRDLHPVIFADWKLPDDHYDLGVSDVTLAQFQSLGVRLGRSTAAPDAASAPSACSRWRLSSMTTLQELLRVCLFVIQRSRQMLTRHDAACARILRHLCRNSIRPAQGPPPTVPAAPARPQ